MIPSSPTLRGLSIPSLSCAVLTDPEEAERLRPEWEDLLTCSERPELTHTPDWLLTWWQVYGLRQGRRLRLVAFRDGVRLVGLAPLAWRRHWYGCLPFRRLELLASGEREGHAICSNHLAVLAERGAGEVVARRLVALLADGGLGPWDEVVLPMMDGDTPMPGLLESAFREAGLHAEVVETARAPYLTLPGTWEEYLSKLPRGHRRQVVRSLAAFDEWAGKDSELVKASTPAELEVGRKVLTELHHSRWCQDGESGVFRAPDYLAFHDLMMPRLLGRQGLELLWLKVRGVPVASLYGMSWGGKVYAYQTGRSMEVPQGIRPGGVLLALAIRSAIESGRREFDFLADEAPYKMQMASGSRPLVRVRAVRPGMRETLRRLGEGCRARVGAVRRRFRGGPARPSGCPAGPTAGRPGEPSPAKVQRLTSRSR